MTKAITRRAAASMLVVGPALHGARARAAEPPKDPPVFRIGARLRLTDKAKRNATVMQRGILMAVDEINAKGGIDGIKVEAAIEDHQGVPRVGVDALERPRARYDIQAVLLSYSTVALASTPICEQNKILMLDGGSVSDALVGKFSYLLHNRAVAGVLARAVLWPRPTRVKASCESPNPSGPPTAARSSRSSRHWPPPATSTPRSPSCAPAIPTFWPSPASMPRATSSRPTTSTRTPTMRGQNSLPRATAPSTAPTRGLCLQLLRGRRRRPDQARQGRRRHLLHRGAIAGGPAGRSQGAERLRWQPGVQPRRKLPEARGHLCHQGRQARIPALRRTGITGRSA
jgi:Periplasmic binding protein